MTDLLKTIVRSNWSVGVSGLRNTAGWVATSTGLATSGQVRDLSRALLQAGDQLNTSMIDALADCTRVDGLQRSARSLLDVSANTTQLLRQDSDGRAARKEFANKLEVFRLVRYEQPDFELGEADEAALRDLVNRAYGGDSHQALWIVEGLAHKYVAAMLARDERPSGLFSRLPAGLPESSMPMLHAGLGLAAAEHLLDGYDPSREDAEVIWHEFVRLCRDNSDVRYLDTALEALGLVARCFYPDSVSPLSAAVRRVAGEQDAPLKDALHTYLWHGVGRGIYFIPLSFVPGYGAIGRAIDTAVGEAPDPAAADAALAGLAYAFNMVNMADPDVLASLVRQRGASLKGGPFARGMLAAFVARQEVTPDCPVLQRCLDHRPPGAEALWDAMVRRPCRLLLAAPSDEERRAVLGELYLSLGQGSRRG